VLFLVPFLAGTGEKSWKRRPVAVLSVLVIVLVVGTLAALAWAGPVVAGGWRRGLPPRHRSGTSTAGLRSSFRGRWFYRTSSAAPCHSLGGEGGQRGPALDGIATRQTRDQLIRQVLQGGGNMPAYGKNLSPLKSTRSSRSWKTLRP